MTGPRAPLPVARAGVELAVRALPDWHDRLRYRAEFLAELHELTPADQLRYSAGVLSQTFALRAALGSHPVERRGGRHDHLHSRAPFWRCRVFRKHRWVIRSTDDGSRYEACSRCGRERPDRYDAHRGYRPGRHARNWRRRRLLAAPSADHRSGGRAWPGPIRARAGARRGRARRPGPAELDDRLRYRAEFLAELHDLSPAGQLRYTAGVLSQTFALRAALGSTPSSVEEDAMTLTRTPFFWRCRILRTHPWVSRSTEDGARYLVCRRCGRDKGEACMGPRQHHRCC